MAEESSKQPILRRVAAAERTLSLLDAFIGRSGPLSLGDLEEATGLFRSVIFRYMISFEECGFVHKTDDGKYRLTGKVLQLAATFEADFSLEDVVYPALKSLSATTSESALFYVPFEDKRICLARVDSPHTVRVSILPGSIRPIDDSATGQVFKAYCGAVVRAPVTAELPFGTSGYWDKSSASISAPVFRAGERFVGALTVSGPVSRFFLSDTAAKDALVATARDLSRTFGATIAYASLPA